MIRIPGTLVATFIVSALQTVLIFLHLQLFACIKPIAATVNLFPLPNPPYLRSSRPASAD